MSGGGWGSDEHERSDETRVQSAEYSTVFASHGRAKEDRAGIADLCAGRRVTVPFAVHNSCCC